MFNEVTQTLNAQLQLRRKFILGTASWRTLKRSVGPNCERVARGSGGLAPAWHGVGDRIDILDEQQRPRYIESGWGGGPFFAIAWP